ncbi:MAG: thioredoxin family protein [Verrucomicrobiae bacterium]|nr:thioredoxin family protein [Verrucomicrobiae bacterium]
MAEVPSTFQLERGASAPPFSLIDGLGNAHSLDQLANERRAVVIAFVCNHCPYVVHLADAMAQCANHYLARGVQFVAISANDVANYPADAPDHMVGFAKEHGWEFPYLYDESQEVAKAYGAACTPDFYVFDADLKLAYAGQFDSSRPGRGDAVTGDDLRAALDSILDSGEGPEQPWIPSTGCNIKWKPGNAPDYF